MPKATRPLEYVCLFPLPVPPVKGQPLLYLLILIYLCGCIRTNSSSPQKELQFNFAIENHGYEIVERKPNCLNIWKEENDSLLVVLTEKGTTFVDVNNYEDLYYRSLIIQIPHDFDCLEYSNKQLSEIKTRFIWNCFSKSIKTKSGDINEGKIKICKTDNQQLKLTFDVNTNFKFGGILLSKNSNWMQTKNTLIDIEDPDSLRTNILCK